MNQGGFRSATVRLLVGLAVVACFGAGALLAIGPNRSTDWKASDCGAPIRWLAGDHADTDPTIVPFSSTVLTLPTEANCSSLVWHQIHWAAGLGATGLGLVATSLVIARRRQPRSAPAPIRPIRHANW